MSNASFIVVTLRYPDDRRPLAAWLAGGTSFAAGV